MIAASFHYAIQHFVVRRELLPDSVFVTGALARLKTYIESGSAGPFPRGNLTFLAGAATPLEKELAQAMAISLTAGK